MPSGHRFRESARRLAYWSLPSLVCLVLYWYGLKTWFQDDDFVWLRLRSQIHGRGDLWGAFFAPMGNGDIRILSERVFFTLFGALFGFDALPFRLGCFLTQFANLALLSSITTRLTGSRAAGFWAPLFWIANSSLVTAMAWTTAYHQALGGFFLLLAFHFLLRRLETGRRAYEAFQWLAFLAGLGALETLVVYPALAAAYTFWRARTYFTRTLPLFVPSLAFAALRVELLRRQPSAVYTVRIDWTLPRTLLNYCRWALEPHHPAAISGYLRWMGVACLAASLAGLTLFVFTRLRRRDWLPVFFLFWFVLVLAPVVPLPGHATESLLPLPLTGLAMLAGYAVASGWGGGKLARAVVVLAAGVYFAGSIPAAWAGTAWWFHRGRAIKPMVLGVARARELHLDKTILLTEVDTQLYWGAVRHHAFLTLGAADVWLAPGSESKIRPRPDLDYDVARFTMPPERVLEEFRQDRLVVYQVGGARLRNITRLYEAVFVEKMKP